MTRIPFGEGVFDAVLDVFSSYCLPEKQFSVCLQEAHRVLRPGGRLFVYTPGKNSSSWRRFAPARKIDRSTLNGIYRKGAPFVGNHYSFRFVSPVELRRHLKKAGFLVEYLGTVRRSYPGVREWFTHVVVYASKVAP